MSDFGDYSLFMRNEKSEKQKPQRPRQTHNCVCLRCGKTGNELSLIDTGGICLCRECCAQLCSDTEENTK